MEKASSDLEPPGGSSRLGADSRHEDVRAEFAQLHKLLDYLGARVAQLEARPEPWLDKVAVARHYSVCVRTVEKWIQKGLPMPIHEGKRKGQLSKLQPWLEVRGYVPRSDGEAVVPALRRAA
jgi:hypothetical protein